MSQSLSNDTLPTSIPKLDHHGENWAIFKIRFQNAMEAKDKWGHFNGLTLWPPQPQPMLPFAPPEAMETESIASEANLVAEWDKNECTVKYMLTQRLPDSTLIHIQCYVTIAEQWSAIIEEYTKKGESAQAELWRDFMELCCGASANVWQFLNDLQTQKEEILACGVNINDDDYRVTIIRSIPKDLADFASSTLSAAQLID